MLNPDFSITFNSWEIGCLRNAVDIALEYKLELQDIVKEALDPFGGTEEERAQFREKLEQIFG